MPLDRTLPSPTDDLERAEHDLREDGICAVVGALDAAVLDEARSALYRAATEDRSRGREVRFGLDHAADTSNQRVWNVLSQAPVFADLAEHPIALGLLRSVLGWPMLLGYRAEGLGLVNGASPQ